MASPALRPIVLLCGQLTLLVRLPAGASRRSSGSGRPTSRITRCEGAALCFVTRPLGLSSVYCSITVTDINRVCHVGRVSGFLNLRRVCSHCDATLLPQQCLIRLHESEIFMSQHHYASRSGPSTFGANPRAGCQEHGVSLSIGIT
jgi:hypothetical protein